MSPEPWQAFVRVIQGHFRNVIIKLRRTRGPSALPVCSIIKLLRATSFAVSDERSFEDVALNMNWDVRRFSVGLRVDSDSDFDLAVA